jgi:hypothetical protein
MPFIFTHRWMEVTEKNTIFSSTCQFARRVLAAFYSRLPAMAT